MKPVRRISVSRLAWMALALCGASATAQTILPTTQFPGTFPIGQTSQPVSLTLTMIASGTSAAPQALTQGLANADFALASDGTCAARTAYTSGQQCSVNVVFQPKFPGARHGAVLLLSTTGTVLAEALLSTVATGSLPVLAPGRIDTVAGEINWIYQGDGGLATASPIFLPTGVLTDAAGNIFLSDSQNNRVRRVDAFTGIISTIAGTGSPGYSGTNVLATQTLVSTPNGLALDGAGNLYLADTGNHLIRRIDAFTGIMTTVAGSPMEQGYSGDTGLATSAKLSLPEAIAFDAAGNLLIADTGNNVVRQIDAATGIIHTLAGSGVAGFSGDGQPATAAQLNGPWGVTSAADGSLYIADLYNNRVRRIDLAGNIATIAGTGVRAFSGDGADAASAQLNEPTSLVFDPAGDLYIADSGNNRIREINATSNLISTFSGTGGEQFEGDAGPANLASLYGPNAIFFDATGNLFIADMFHNRIRRVSGSATALLFDPIKVGKLSPPQAVTVANDGNASLTLTTPALANASEDPATTTCTNAASIASAATCVVGAVFAPTVTGDPVLGSITVDSNSLYTAPIIDLSGQVLSIQPTAASLISSANPSLVGSDVTFTSAVTGGTADLSGTIVFLDNTTRLCSVTLTGTSATCSTSTLILGPHNITANYSGDNNNAASTSSTLVQVVKQAPTLTLTVSPNPATVTASVTLSLTSTDPSGTITGTVSFYDGPTALNAATLSAAGTASFSTTSLTPGSHTLSVHYAGDSLNMAAQSNTVTEVIQQGSTTTSLYSSNATAEAGTQVTFTAVVFSANGPTPTGTVAFMSGSTTLGTSTVDPSGNATLVLSTLAPGAYSLTAVYSGDTDDQASSSTSLLETIQQIATATTLSSSATPIAAGATLTLTATVSGATTGGGALNGKVRFHEGTTTYGSALLNASGVASLQLTTLPAGSHNLVATFVGDTNYAASSSTALVQVVDSTASTTVLTSPAASTIAGETATFTATVTSATSTPTGNVVFNDAGIAIGQIQLNAQGIATLTTTALAVGSHSITAVYQGDGSYNTSTSTTLAHSVTLAITALQLAAPSAALDASVPFAVTASLSSNGIAPTGTLTLRDGSTTIGTQSVAADGTFSFPGLTLAVGTHTLTALYAGDTNNASATSPAVSVVVQLAPTTTAVATSANPAATGQTVTFTATVASDSPNPTGTLTFKDGATTLGSIAITAGSATLTTSTLAFGSHILTASYSGDTNHAASTSPSLTQQIVQLATATLASSLNPANAGSNITFTVNISGSTAPLPTGTVTFKDAATTLGTSTLDANASATLQTAALAVGSHPITASYSGDASNSIASASLTQTIQSESTTITLAASADPATYQSTLTLTAIVTGNGGIAIGTVTFTDSAAALGTATLDSTGKATLPISTLSPGLHSIVANYSGSASTNASSSTPLALSVKEPVGISLYSNADPSPTLSPLTLIATVTNSGVGTPTGSITFVDGSTQLGTAALDASGKATLALTSLTAGDHPLQATYAGDASNFSGASPILTQTVQLRPTSVTLTASTAANATNPLEVTLIAVVRWDGITTPTGTVSFTSGSTVLGSASVDSSGVATLTVTLAASPENVAATYSGDPSYATSASPVTSITAAPSLPFTMTIDPPAVTFASKQHTTVTVSLASQQGFTDTLQLGCLGLPYAATCTFSSPQMALAANATGSVQLTVDTGDPLGAGASASAHTTHRSSTVLLCLLPCLLVLGLTKRRRFHPAQLLLLLCIATITLSAAGCSALQINGTPPGTYTFKVTASGVNTGTTLSQTMTLTVTQ